MLDIRCDASRLEQVGAINKFVLSTGLSNQVFYQTFLEELYKQKQTESTKVNTNKQNKSTVIIEEHNELLDNLLNDKEFSSKEKEYIAKMRIGQNCFRDKLLSIHKKCQLSGISNHSLLIASHIKPFRDCNLKEAYDSNNGLLLCSLLDSLFDSGLITFNHKNGEISYSYELSNNDIDAISKILITNKIEIKITAVKPNGFSAKGTATFIPQIPEIIVGIARTTVIEVSLFITLFRLLDIIVEKASRVLTKTLEYILAISIACFVSIIISSRSSISSGYFLTSCILIILSRTASFDFNDVVK